MASILDWQAKTQLNSNSITFTPATNPVVGNELIIIVAVNNISTVTCTDSQGNTYTKINQRGFDGGNTQQVWYTHVTVGGASTITIADASARDWMVWMILIDAADYNSDGANNDVFSGVSSIAVGPSSPAPPTNALFISSTYCDGTGVTTQTPSAGWNSGSPWGFNSGTMTTIQSITTGSFGNSPGVASVAVLQASVVESNTWTYNGTSGSGACASIQSFGTIPASDTLLAQAWM